MKKSLIFSSFCLICFGSMYSQSYSYEPEIIDSLLTGIPIKKIVWDSKDTLWFLSNANGLNKSYGDSVWHYNSSNSNLTSEEVKSIAIDSKDTIWLVTEKGLVKFDHNNFTTYDTTNTNILPYSYHELAVDKDDNIWFSSSDAIGGGRGGLIKFDKKEWHVYTPDNSLLPVPHIKSIVIDNGNNIWVACSGFNTYLHNIVKINLNNWTVFNEGNIKIPIYSFLAKTLDIDKNDNLYVKIDYSYSSGDNTGKPSLIKFDGMNWSIIDTVNGIGDWPFVFGFDHYNYLWTYSWNSVLYYYIDNKRIRWDELKVSMNDIMTGIDSNLWLCTSNGVYILKTDIPDKTNSIFNNEKITIFPNPTQGIINIDFDEYAYCEVYSMMGVRLLTTKDKTIDLKNFESGIYFVNIKDKRGKKEIRKVILKKEY
ncbi:T9SS type A sorting domain-containing protein [Saccharicrinis sp. FJH54]|uniref:T9SS type A sorting domain-containing protein n=1 Tax=Saccharicrinis sp. FJH54 TaxID=3344665 RepID=UPI0035D527B6